MVFENIFNIETVVSVALSNVILKEEEKVICNELSDALMLTGALGLRIY